MKETSADLVVSIIRLESWCGECNDMVKRKLKRKQETRNCGKLQRGVWYASAINHIVTT